MVSCGGVSVLPDDLGGVVKVTSALILSVEAP